jgi:hypothetical protein
MITGKKWEVENVSQANNKGARLAICSLSVASQPVS